MSSINPEALNNDDVWYSVETKNFKLTVEETRDKKEPFIATFWDKRMELEIDRTVLGSFETSSGALGMALNKIQELVNIGELK